MSSPHLVDISNTAKESRKAVAQCVEELPWLAACRKLDPKAELVWIDRALPVKKFHLQRIASNRRVYQRANRFFGMDTTVTKCALKQAMNTLNVIRKACDNNISSSDDPATTCDIHHHKETLFEFENHLPRSWCLPQDASQFGLHRESFNEEKASEKTEESIIDKQFVGEKWYIAKPDAGRCGRGIGLFSNLKEIAEEFEAGSLCTYPEDETNGGSEDIAKANSTASTLPGASFKKFKSSEAVLVQEYISRPLLFRETGRKFDLRIYVIVKRLSPSLEAKIFTEGLVRVATTPYEPPNSQNCSISTMHLTNSHINSKVVGHKSGEVRSIAAEEGKLAENSVRGKGAADASSHSVDQRPSNSTKFTVTDTLRWISEDRGIPMADIWMNIRKAVSSAIVAIHPFASLKHASCYGTGDEANETRCFQLLGVDVLLDHNLKPWVLEINNSPSLNLSTKADERIKLPLIKAMLAEVFGHENCDSIDSAPQFEPINFGGNAAVTIETQKRILEFYMHLCGWRPGSCRPLKSIMPSREMHSKLCKAASGQVNISESLKWEEAEFPSRDECNFSSFTMWLTSVAAASSLSINEMLAQIQLMLT